MAETVSIAWTATAYAPITVNSDDLLVFHYITPVHDVWQAPTAAEFNSCSTNGGIMHCDIGEVDCQIPVPLLLANMINTTTAMTIVYLICTIHCGVAEQRIQVTVIGQANQSTSTMAPTLLPNTTAVMLSPILISHLSFMLTAYGVLMPIGAVIALGRDPTTSRWFAYHQSIQFIALLLSLTGMGLGIAYSVQYSQAHLANRHQQIGIAVNILACWQVFNGALRPKHKRAEEAHESRARVLWAFAHRATASAVLILGLTNLVIGPLDFQIILRASDASTAVQSVSWTLVGLASLAILLAVLMRLVKLFKT